MIRILVLFSILTLTACVSAPKRTVTVTKADGHSYVTTVPEIADPRTHADGTRMDWVELAVVKANGALPPHKEQPVWACMGADLGTTGVGLSMGLAEANPLGWAALPFGVGAAVWAKNMERKGQPFPAKAQAVVHCGAAIWNLVQIALILI